MHSEKATANGKSTGSFTLLAILEVLEVLDSLELAKYQEYPVYLEKKKAADFNA